MGATHLPTDGAVVLGCALSSSTLSKCCHATVALLYPFTWQHTYIPVLPPSMIDIVCSPTPFLIGLLSSSLPRLKELPVEEVSNAQQCFFPQAQLSSGPERLLSTYEFCLKWQS